MNRKSGLIIFLVAFLCVVVSIAALFGYQYLGGTPKPTITLINPTQNQILESGAGLMLTAQAEAEAGVARVVLLVDGQPYTEQTGTGETAYLATIPWYASSLGPHTLELVAYDAGGQASEPAALEVGTVARNALAGGLDFVFVPADDPDADPSGPAGNPEDSAGNQPAGNGRIVPVDAAPAPDAAAQRQQNEEAVAEEILGDPIAPEDIDNLPAAGDHPPTITSLTVSPHYQGQEVVPAYVVEAQDDVGLASLEIYVEHDTSGTGEYRAHACSAALTCQGADFYPVPAGPGKWVVTVYAIDISGQVSDPQFGVLEVLDGDNAAPAVAVLDFGIANLGQHVQDIAIPDFGVPADLGIERDDDLPANVITNEVGCNRGLVEPRENGHFISLEYLCELEAPAPGYFLSWEIRAAVFGAGGDYQTILKRDFEDITSLFPGQNFAHLHEDPFCGNWTYYRVFLRWKNANGTEHYAGGIDLIDVPGPACGSDYPIQNFQSVASLEGINLTWDIHSEASFSYEIKRYHRAEFESVSIANGRYEAGESGTSAAFLDSSVPCGYRDYVYILATTIRLPNGKPATASTRLDQVPCPPGSVGNLQIDLDVGYRLDESNELLWEGVYVSALTARSSIPADFAWPAGNNLVLRLAVEDIGSFGGGAHSLVPGNSLELPITEQVKSAGAQFATTLNVECSATHHTWGVAWELLADGQVVSTGQQFKIKSPPCLPRYTAAPEFTLIYGSSDPAVCGEVPYCVVIQWTELPPHPENQSTDTTLHVTGLGLFRDVASLDGVNLSLPDVYHQLPSDRVFFVDKDVVCVEPGTSYSLRYNLRPLADGLHGSLIGPNTAFIDAPVCGQTYDRQGSLH